MKRLNKLLSILLALAMLLSLTVSVAATTYTIKIEPTTGTTIAAGETYYAFKIFDAEVSGTNYAYTIESTSAFFNAIAAISNVTYTDGVGTNTTPAGAVFNLTQVSGGTTFTVTVVDGTGDDDVIAAVKSAIASLIDTTNEYDATHLNGYKYTGTTDASGSATIEVDEGDDGYYYITTTVGSLVTIGTLIENVTLNNKNETPSVDKKVSDDGTAYSDDDTSAQIGDTVYYESIIPGIADITSLTLHDDLETGLNLDADSIKVYLVADYTNFDLSTATPVSDSLYTIKLKSESEITAHTHGTDSFDCDFEIVLDNLLIDSTSAAFIDSAVSNNTVPAIVVTYTSTVNSGAEIYTDTNTNTTYVSYGESSYSEVNSVNTNVYELKIYKYDANGALEDVGFKLYYYTDDNAKASDTRTYVSVTAGTSPTYVVDGTDNTGDEMTTNASGLIYIDGLDSDKTYYLEETTTPSGYNSLSGPVEIKIGTSGTITYTPTGGSETSGASLVEILNQSGSELPGTGGMGTTIFYMVGGVLVVGAVILLITKRRLSNSER